MFGDRTDGTYLGIDDVHAHINIPAALMFARGWFERPARVTFVQPPGKKWRVATQLFPTADPLVFTAPNIHYLMDSPTEFSNFTLREFTVDDGRKRNGPPPTFRIALTHDGTEAEADAFAKDVERIVRETIPIFGELPDFETNTYTFLSTYLPWASGDGMEHRNSTSLTSSGALRNPSQRQGILGTVAHEFFHAWNMERIRSAGVEPFDFEEADMSDDLWLGEGFTNYFDGLIQRRAGLTSLDGFAGRARRRHQRRHAQPGPDVPQRRGHEPAGAVRRRRRVDRSHRVAEPVHLVLHLRPGDWPRPRSVAARSHRTARSPAIDYMSALWAQFGRPGQKEPGKVSHGVHDRRTEGDAGQGRRRSRRSRTISSRKFVEGRELVDYARLLARAGLMLRKRAAGRAFAGQVQLQAGGSALRVTGLVPWESPLYKAGVAQDDQLVNLDGVASDVDRELGRGRSRATRPATACRCDSCDAAAKP